MDSVPNVIINLVMKFNDNQKELQKLFFLLYELWRDCCLTTVDTLCIVAKGQTTELREDVV